MRTRIVMFVALAAIVCAQVWGANETESASSGSTTSDSSAASPIDEGMKPLYDMTNGFLQLVQPNDVFDKLREKGIITDDKVDVTALIDSFTSDWGFWAQYMLGYLICVVVGLLFIIVIIFTGLIFCCCRCCGKCGGRVNPQEGKKARCKRISCGVSLFILNSIMVAGMIMAFMSNELLRRETAQDPKAALPTIAANLHSIDVYKDNTIQTIRRNIFDRLNIKTDQVIDKIKAFPQEAQETVGELTEAQKILEAASKLADSVTEINATLHDVKKYSDELKQQGQSLAASLTTWQSDVQASLTSCSGNTQCQQLSTQVNALSPEADFNNLGDVSQPLARVKDVVDGDLGKLILKSQDEYNRIQQNVRNNATKEISDAVEKVVPDVEKEAKKLMDKVNQVVADFELQAKKFNLNGTRNSIRKYEPLVETYGNYRWYAGIGLSCILLLIILFYYLGLAFGACGEPPYEEASTCNRGVGANMLMAGVGFTFIFSWILMLLTLILFLAGGLTYTEVCRHVVKVENSNVVSEADKVVANLLKEANISLEFEIGDVLRGCKDNEPIYKVLSLDKILNVTDVLDLNKWGIRDLIEEIGKIDINLGTVDILDANTRSQLETLASADLDGISFSSFRNELTKAVTNQDLNGLVAQINDLADEFGTNIAVQNSMRQHANSLQDIQTNEVDPIVQNMESLNLAVEKLEQELDTTTGTERFQEYTRDLLREYDAAAQKIQVNASRIVITFLKEKALNIYDDFQEYILEVSGNVQNEIGRCRPVYEALDSSIDTACVQVLNPFNGFWFSMGWCLFFFVPSLIIAVKLATLYRKTDEYDGPDTKSFDDPNFDAYTGVYPGDNIPLEDVERKKHYRNGRGHQNTAYDREDYGANRHHADHYHRDNSYNQAAPGYTTYDRQGYAGGGYGGGATPPNPPHYYNNRNRMY